MIRHLLHPITLTLAALTGLAIAVALLWHWLILAAVTAFCGRILLHLAGYRRRKRPRSSWAALIRSAAMAYAAWNSRWLKPKQERPKRRGPVGFTSNLYPSRGRYDSTTTQGDLPKGY